LTGTTIGASSNSQPQHLKSMGGFSEVGSQCASPNRKYSPVDVFKRLSMLSIPFSVALDLLFPIGHVCAGQLGAVASVAVPKAPMHEDNRSIARQHYVG
jgi:hypothetical protein